MRALVLSTLAAGLGGTASADVPPFEPPMTPIAAACEPLLGAWQSDLQYGKYYSYTVWMFINSDGVTTATFSNYSEGKQFVAETETVSEVTCTPGENGTIAVKVGDGEATIYTQTDETTLTEGRMTSYMGNGAPLPDWKSEPYTVTWKRVAK